MNETIHPPTSKPVYGLPHNDKEFERLDLQHEAVKLAFEGLNVCDEQVDKILEASDNQKSVLDVGSGSGAWCIDMAERYPHVHVLGIDIKPQHRSNVPSNYLSEICDVNDGLEKFYGQFDLVHTRFTAGVFSDPQAALIEMERCLKPGGLLIIISASFLISEDRKTMYPLYTQANPQGSWFQRSAIGEYHVPNLRPPNIHMGKEDSLESRN